jgi:hypothetical protein
MTKLFFSGRSFDSEGEQGEKEPRLSTACLYKKNGKLPALPLHSAQGNQDPQSHNTLGVCSKRT